ncbi:MAG TPA: hypothetical protein VF556_12690 [Pyrinomonadaceae bacterium]|jgi:hypothetical protein
MSEKKFIVKPGGRVIIEINRSPEQKKNFTGHLSPKGLIKMRREDDYLPRRKKKQTVGWRFFDLGQEPFEDYFVDRMFFGNAGITPDYSGDVVNVNDDVPASDIEAKNDFYTSINPELLSTDFFQLVENSADVFRVSIQTPSIGQTILTSDNSRWQNGKIIIAENESLDWLIIRGNPLFSSVFLYLTDALRPFGCKVTATPDFTAPELTDFELTRTADFYFTPGFTMPNVEIKGRHPNDRPEHFYYADESGNPLAPVETPYNYTQTLYANYLTFPRNDLVHLMTTWANAGYAITDTAPFDSSQYALFYELQNYLEALPGTRNMRLLQGVYVTNNPDEPQITHPRNVLEDASVSAPTWAFPNPDYFPPPPASPVVTNVDDRAVEYDAVWFTNAASGELRMIIKQNGNFYYVWQR